MSLSYMRRRAVMCDMETVALGTRPVIATAAFVLFDPFGNDTPESLLDGQWLHFAPSSTEQAEKLREVNEQTLDWWANQDEKVRARVFGHEKAPVLEALSELHRWWKANQAEEIWSFGATADVVWLETLCKDFGMPQPHSYRQVRCLRTMAEITGVPRPVYPGLDKHDALHDAITQALWLQEIMHKIDTPAPALKEAA